MSIVDKRKIAELLKGYISYYSIKELESLIEVPPPDISFTYAFPCYRLSKHEKKAPNQIAEDLAKKIEIPEYLNEIKSTGPYINFRAKAKFILKNIFTYNEDYGKIREKINSESLNK